MNRKDSFADCRRSVLLHALLVYLPITQAYAVSMIASVVLLPPHFQWKTAAEEPSLEELYRRSKFPPDPFPRSQPRS